MAIRLLLADDSYLVREGVSREADTHRRVRRPGNNVVRVIELDGTIRRERRYRMLLRPIRCVLVVATAGVLLGAQSVSAQRLSPAIPLVANWKASLHGTSVDPAIRGNAGYTLATTDPPYRAFRVTLSRAGTYSGRRLGVYLGGAFVGWMRVGSHGRAHFSRSTAKNQVVPELRKAHFRVAVKTRRGVRVATGRLRLIS